MLREHLSQDHDMASRRFEIIDRHIAWIHEKVLSGKPSKILDLGCGPGHESLSEDSFSWFDKLSAAAESEDIHGGESSRRIGTPILISEDTTNGIL